MVQLVESTNRVLILLLSSVAFRMSSKKVVSGLSIPESLYYSKSTQPENVYVVVT